MIGAIGDGCIWYQAVMSITPVGYPVRYSSNRDSYLLVT